MKRRETKSWEENEGRSALVRAGSRWLSFARSLSRGRVRRMVVADTLAFIESLYGGKFKAVEGGAFSLDKVYRTSGGGLFVSETRLSVSLQPRFDLRLLNVAYGRVVSQVFRGETTEAAFNLLTHAGASVSEQPRAARHFTNIDSRSFQSHSTTLFHTVSSVAFPLLQQRTHFGGPQTTTMLPGVERLLPALGVSIHGQLALQPQEIESARQVFRVERLVRGDVATSPSAGTSQPSVAPTPARLRLTSPDIGRHVVHAPRQAFVSVLLYTYLPAVVSRELLRVRTTGDLSAVSPRRATTQDEIERRFAPAPGVTKRRPTAWTYAGPSPRHAPGSAFEIRREFHSTETSREHAWALDPQPPMLHVLPPASLLLSLSENSLTVLTGGTGAAGQTSYQLGGHAPALLLQHLHTHTAPSGTREESADVDTPRLLVQTPQQQTPRQPAGARPVLTSLNTFVERAHSTFIERVRSTVAGITQAYSTVFTRPGFERTLHTGFEQVSARQRRASSSTAPGDATPRGLLGRAVEFVRPASDAVFTREASTHEPSTQSRPDQTPGVFSTQGATGARTFHFVTELLRRSGRTSTEGALSSSGALSPAAATALRLAAAVETARVSGEARAARPEGMALELIRHRREEVLRLPQPGYVFTQPSRSQLEERQVITKASREEIVEVVRKEVRTLAASTHTVPAPSHADIAGLADEVYSTLVRRLLVEKERLGRF